MAQPTWDDRHRSARSCTNLHWEKRREAPPGFEPGMADLQSAALPLGEGAVGTRCILTGQAGRVNRTWKRGRRWKEERLASVIRQLSDPHRPFSGARFLDPSLHCYLNRIAELPAQAFGFFLLHLTIL